VLVVGGCQGSLSLPAIRRPARTSAICSAQVWDSVMITQPSPTAGPLPPSRPARTGPTNCSPPTSGASTSSGAATPQSTRSRRRQLLGALFQRAFFSAFSGEPIPAARRQLRGPARSPAFCPAGPALIAAQFRRATGADTTPGWRLSWVGCARGRSCSSIATGSTPSACRPTVPASPASPLTRPRCAPHTPLWCPSRAPCRALPRAHKAWEHAQAADSRTLGQRELVVETTFRLP